MKIRTLLGLLLLLFVAVETGIFRAGVIKDNAQNPTGQVNGTATEDSASAAATRVGNWTGTPGTYGNGTVPSLIPWTDNYENMGTVQGLITGWKQIYATSSFDLKVSTVDDFGGVGIYCISRFGTNPLVFWIKPIDHSIPLAANYGPGSGYTENVGTRYCSMWLVQEELWGGVVSSDIDTIVTDATHANVFTPADLEKMKKENKTIPAGYPWVLVTPYDLPVTDDETTHQHIHTQGMDIEFHLPFGLLTNSVQPLNQVEKHIGKPPNGVMVEINDTANVINSWIGHDPGQDYWMEIDAANTNARQLADLDAIAPWDDSGHRDYSHLDLLKTDMEKAYNMSNPDPAGPKWPYESMVAFAQKIAEKGNYKQVRSVKVVLEWPTGVENEWVTSESLAGHGTWNMVIKPTDLDPYKDNLYVLFRPDINSFNMKDLLADWAKKLYRLPDWPKP